MKVILSLALIIFGCLSSYSQTTAFSEPKPFNFSKEIFSIGDWRGGNLPVFYTERSKSFLDLYNSKMERKAIVTLNFFPERVNQVDLFEGSGSNSNILYSGLEGTKEVFYAAQVDNRGKLVKGPLVMDTANTTFVRKQKKSYFMLASPLQRLSALFGYQIKDEQLIFKYKILDKELNVVRERAGVISCKNSMTVEHILLTENAELLVLVTDKFHNRAEVISEAVLYTFRENSEGGSDFSLENNVLESLVMKSDYTDPQKLYFAGFYKPLRSGYLLGTFISRHNLSKRLVEGQFISFSESLRNLYRDKNKKKELNLFTVRDIIVKNDGGMMIFAETFYEIIRNFGNGMRYNNYSNYSIGPNNYHEYNYGDILVMDYDQNLNNKWFSLIEKEQRTADDNGVFSSFTVLNSGANLGIIYNNFIGSSNRPQYTVIDSEGKKSYRNLPRAGGSSSWLNILGKQTGMKEMVVPIVSGSNLIFGKVQF